MCPLENHSGSGVEERPGQGEKPEAGKCMPAKMKQSRMTNVPSNLLDLLSGVLIFLHSSLGKPMDPFSDQCFYTQKIKNPGL